MGYLEDYDATLGSYLSSAGVKPQGGTAVAELVSDARLYGMPTGTPVTGVTPVPTGIGPLGPSVVPADAIIQPETRQRCIDAILHRTPMDLSGQMSCASQGYSGNGAWPIPQPMVTVSNPNPPTNMVTTPAVQEEKIVFSKIVPQVGELIGSNQSTPTCGGGIASDLFNLIQDNPVVAGAALVVLWFMKGSK